GDRGDVDVGAGRLVAVGDGLGGAGAVIGVADTMVIRGAVPAGLLHRGQVPGVVVLVGVTQHRRRRRAVPAGLLHRGERAAAVVPVVGGRSVLGLGPDAPTWEIGGVLDGAVGLAHSSLVPNMVILDAGGAAGAVLDSRLGHRGGAPVPVQHPGGDVS